MCLIIECNQHIPLTKTLITEFYRRNDDGFGIMWVENEELKVEKFAAGSLDLLWDKYQAAKQFDPLIHLRQKTHGLVDHTNTHPYPVGNTGIYLMHNGILSGGNSSDTSKSDTWHFIDKVIEPILSWANDPSDAIRSHKFRVLIERIIGSSNRIAMGDKHGYVLFNKEAWTTISEPTTNAVGLRVSNSYAWDEGFARPKVVTPAESSNTSKHGKAGVVVVHGTNIVHYRRNDTVGMIEIDNNLWADEDGEIWEMEKGVLWRMTADSKKSRRAKKRLRRRERLLEKKMEELVQPSQPKTETKQIEIPALCAPPVCVPGTEPVIVVTATDSEEHSEIVLPDESYDAQDAYLAELEREWSQMSLSNLNAMVYTDPDSAAMLLHKRLHQ